MTQQVINLADMNPQQQQALRHNSHYLEEFIHLMGLDRNSPIGQGSFFSAICAKCKHRRAVCKRVEVTDLQCEETWCLGCIGMYMLKTQKWQNAQGRPFANPAASPASIPILSTPWSTTK